MLTRNSILNLAWLAARTRENPIFGGAPVLERDSAAWIRGQGNGLYSLPRLNPRFELVTPNGASQPLTAMRLELARVNRMVVSRDFGSWSATSATVTGGQPDPRGGVDSRLIATTGAGGSISKAVTTVGDGTKTVFVIARKGTGTAPAFGLIDGSGTPTWRGAVSVTWNASGAPTLATILGTVTSKGSIEFAAGYWLIFAEIPSVVAANNNNIYFYPGGTAGTGTAYLNHVQVEDGAFPTSVIDSDGASAGIRAVEKFRFGSVPFANQNTIVYGELIYGSDKSAAPYRFSFGDGSGAYLAVYHDTNGTMKMVLHNGSSSTTLATADIGAAFNDRVDYAALINTDRSARIIARVNRLSTYAAALPAGGGGTVTHPSQYAGQEVWLNGRGSSNHGASWYTKLIAFNPADMLTNPLSGDAQTVMAELQLASELRISGETI